MATEEQQLAVLDNELTRVAELEAAASNTEIAIVAAQVVIHAGVLTVILQTSQLTGDLAGADLGVGWLLLPLVPYWMTGFHMMLGARSTLRGFYSRALERRVQRLSSNFVDLDPETQLVAPSYFHLIHTASSSRSAFPEQKALYLAGIIVMQCLMIAEAAWCIGQVEGAAATLFGTLTYSFLAILIFTYTIRITIGGPNLWKWTLRSVTSVWGRPLGPVSIDGPSRALSDVPAPLLGSMQKQLSVRGYLRHPRPLLETTNKSLLGLVIVGIALAAPGSASDTSQIWLAIGLVLWFEFVMYPARCYVNDALDSAKATTPSDRGLGRPHVGVDVTSALLWRLAGFRFLVGAGGLAVIADLANMRHATAFVVGISLSLVVVAMAYEVVRWQFATYAPGARSRVALACYLVSLGGGYALRAYVALYAGLGAWALELHGVLFAAGAGLLGTVTVIMSLADVARMLEVVRPGSVGLRRQGHVEWLMALDISQPPPVAPGLARYRERAIALISPYAWLYLPSCALLVYGLASYVGEVSVGSRLCLSALVIAFQLGYVALRRLPTALWIPICAIGPLCIWALVADQLSFGEYMWISTPIIATMSYFEWFRNASPAVMARFEMPSPTGP